MIKDTEIKEFRSDDPTSFLSNPDQRRKIDMVKTEEVKEPKKRVVEPIEMPEIISVPRTQPIIRTEPPESYNTEPEIGLSKRFTQDKMREAQISKQLDQELANERNRGRTLNKRGTK